MYCSPSDIQAIRSLMSDIKAGRISRNKNFFTLAKEEEFQRFKRAKLLLSLLSDLESTSLVQGNSMGIETKPNQVEVFLHNPMLKYRRRVALSAAELRLIQDQSHLLAQD